MEPTIYTPLKVNNEIELCEIDDLDCKQQIEREFLKNHISYFVRWPKTSIFSHKKNLCILCVNENSQEPAEAIVRNICDESGYRVKFLLRKSNNEYL